MKFFLLLISTFYRITTVIITIMDQNNITRKILKNSINSNCELEPFLKTYPAHTGAHLCVPAHNCAYSRTPVHICILQTPKHPCTPTHNRANPRTPMHTRTYPRISMHAYQTFARTSSCPHMTFVTCEKS